MPLHRHLAAVDEGYRAFRREIEAFSMLARRAPRTTVARITAVVHVLHRTEAENISDEQIQSQIDVLNADFRARNTDIDKVPAAFAPKVGDALVEFALATEDPDGRQSNGITRTRTRRTRVRRGHRRRSTSRSRWTSGATAWPAGRYLNLWVCTLGSGLLGYAQFPGGPADRDGVVILNTAFGTTGTVEAPFDLGRTATHEVGHWLNLLHIWGDDDLGCRGSDNVADTPNQAGSNVGCPQFPQRVVPERAPRRHVHELHGLHRRRVHVPLHPRAGAADARRAGRPAGEPGRARTRTKRGSASLEVAGVPRPGAARRNPSRASGRPSCSTASTGSDARGPERARLRALALLPRGRRARACIGLATARFRPAAARGTASTSSRTGASARYTPGAADASTARDGRWTAAGARHRGGVRRWRAGPRRSRSWTRRPESLKVRRA